MRSLFVSNEVLMQIEDDFGGYPEDCQRRSSPPRAQRFYQRFTDSGFQIQRGGFRAMVQTAQFRLHVQNSFVRQWTEFLKCTRKVNQI